MGDWNEIHKMLEGWMIVFGIITFGALAFAVVFTLCGVR